MKTISDYAIYCTEAQTRKALELGVPLFRLYSMNLSDYIDMIRISDNEAYTIPTAEQMRGWLMDKLQVTTFANKHYSNGDVEGYGYLIIGAECVLECDADDNGKHLLKSDKAATLAAIDAALDYLANKK